MSAMSSKLVRAFVRLETEDGRTYEVELVDHPERKLTGTVEVDNEAVEVDPFVHGEPWRIFEPGPRSATVSISGRVSTIERIVQP